MESSSPAVGLAVWRDGRVVSELTSRAERPQAAAMVDDVHRVLAQAGMALEEIGGLVVSRGPGSFTGLRVGVTLVNALAYGLSKPAVGVPSLEVLAHGVAASALDVCTVVDARRRLVYAALFSPGHGGRLRRRGRERLAAVEALLGGITRRTLFVGDGLAVYGPSIARRLGRRAVLADRAHWWPRVGVLAALGAARWTRTAAHSHAPLVPLYLHSRTCTTVRL